MSHSSKYGRWMLLLSALTAALLWLASVPPGRAAAYTYSARQRTINAGVLYVGSAGDTNPALTNPAPYVFYVLNQRADIKPVGWTFINPQAPGIVNTQSSRRWGYPTTPVIPVTPDMAVYWEVPLRDVAADQLQHYDVLYLHISMTGYSAVFTPSDNEKLRRFVDNGGQLIVEYGGSVTAPSLFADISWATGSNANVTLVSPSSILLALHPLAVQPYPLTPNNTLGLPDLRLPFLLGTANDTNSFGTLGMIGSGEYANLFGPVLFRTATQPPTTPAVPDPSPAVVAAQLGGGQIIASALDIGRHVTLSTGSSFGQNNNPDFASVGDLKFLSNMISWADTHPAENQTSHQNAASPSAASFAPAWSFPVKSSSTTGPPGAAVWGNYVYVTDSAGVLHAFDAYPDEDLLGDGADNGIPDFLGTTPTSYDEVWNAPLGAGTSAPTVGSFKDAKTGYQTFVFVEKADGSVLIFNAINNVANAAVVKTLTPPAGSNSGATTFPGNAPAPTYYDGRIYAGQPNGDLYIYSLNGMGSAGSNGGVDGVRIPLNRTSTNTEVVTASPAVGVIAPDTTASMIVAHVSTNQELYTVLLGARNDPLIPYEVNGNLQGYNVNRNLRYRLPNLFVDLTSIPVTLAYDTNYNSPLSAGSGQDPVFPSLTVGTFYGDWDMDFGKSTSTASNSTVTLYAIKAESYAASVNSGILSAPAVDRGGDSYYTVNDGQNSYLIGVHDANLQQNVHLKFRFRLPLTTDPTAVDSNGNSWDKTDADNVDYTNLLDFKFVGAPVVDGQGNVYVAAQNGTTAAVLCFNGNKEVTAEPRAPAPSGFDASKTTFYQYDENNASPLVKNDLLGSFPQGGNGNTAAARTGQEFGTGNVVTVFNFGRSSGNNREIAGNATEPQWLIANAFTNNDQNGTPTPVAETPVYFHTNLAWYTKFSVNGPITGVSKAGSTLMLVDSPGGSSGFNVLYKLPANPIVGTGKIAKITPIRSPLGTDALGKNLNLGTVTAAPSAGGGAMAINGTAGVAAFNQQLTLIADNNRILQVDADGNAIWSADATTRDQGNGVATKVDFGHPTALAEVAPNDYLVADTGNSRCVRFDHAGKVLWELTRFYDPAGLMAPGQPLTLSQPSSVELHQFADTDPNNPGGTRVSYLIADSGNSRIVEVTDTYNTQGALIGNHILTWVSHTGDQYGRRYRYTGASYLVIPPTTATPNQTTVEIVALVTNTRIAPLVPPTAPATQFSLASANADSPGGSIVLFNRPVPQRSFSDTALTQDLIYVANAFTVGLAPNGVTYPVRSPRYLHVYAPPQPMAANPLASIFSFLYADANGAFDLTFVPPLPSGQQPPPFSNGLAFTQRDYQNMTALNIAADTPGNVPLRLPGSGIPGIPFVPACVQRLNNDATNTPITPTTNHVERYLITQSSGQAELGRAPGSPLPTRIGGEIFEVDVVTVNGVVTTVPVGGFGSGVTLSHPVSTGPLTQPTFAIRTPQ